MEILIAAFLVVYLIVCFSFATFFEKYSTGREAVHLRISLFSMACGMVIGLLFLPLALKDRFPALREWGVLTNIICAIPLIISFIRSYWEMCSKDKNDPETNFVEETLGDLCKASASSSLGFPAPEEQLEDGAVYFVENFARTSHGFLAQLRKEGEVKSRQYLLTTVTRMWGNAYYRVTKTAFGEARGTRIHFIHMREPATP